MPIPSPAATAAPLNLYDYTHGQRRLSVWQEPDPSGTLATHAALAVPVTMQAPGEPPETQWVQVATGRAFVATLVRQWASGPRRCMMETWQLNLGESQFTIYRMEAEAIAAYLGIDPAALDAELTP